MPKIYVECNVETCAHNKNGSCICDVITICEGNCMSIEEVEKNV